MNYLFFAFVGTLTENDEFCSCCILRSIIGNIHRNIQQLSNSFSELSQASAVSFMRYITRLSPSFVSGRQEDPSEFLVVLIDHLIQCLSPTHSSLNTINLSNPIHIIFGIIVKSSIKCTQCLNETSKENYESVWSIPIISFSTLEQALDSFCSVEELSGDNMFFCSNCEKKVVGLQSTQLAHTSPVIFFQFKRFVYNKNVKVTHKIKEFISYPEVLDMAPFITSDVVESLHQQHKSNEYIYKLNAVVAHLGETVNSGHIFSYIRSPDNTWYEADDELVKKTDLHVVLTDNNSYILCYTKTSEDNIISQEKELFQSFTEPLHKILSSTPIRLDDTICKSSDRQSAVTLNSILIILIFPLLSRFV